MDVDGRRRYTNNELFDMIMVYSECRQNCREAARIYAMRFPERRHPHKGLFQFTATKLRVLSFCQSAAVCDLVLMLLQ